MRKNIYSIEVRHAAIVQIHRIEMEHKNEILAVTMFLLYSYLNYLKIPKLQFEVYQPNLLKVQEVFNNRLKSVDN